MVKKLTEVFWLEKLDRGQNDSQTLLNIYFSSLISKLDWKLCHKMA